MIRWALCLLLAATVAAAAPTGKATRILSPRFFPGWQAHNVGVVRDVGFAIGLATSPDGVTWTKQPGKAGADWNGDGRKDLLFGMVGEGPSRHYDRPPLNRDRTRDRGILYYPNVGTEAAPVLGAPRWVKTGLEGAPADLLRPNLGDCVDWDGDGARDLIVCEFENFCQMFRNTTGGRPGRKPLFAGAAGIMRDGAGAR